MFAMDAKRVRVIINPISGTDSKDSIPAKIAERIDQHQTHVEFFFTGYAGHAAAIAHEAVEDGVDLVVAVGGDGTVNEVAKSLVGSSSTLGIIPFGSGNGLARDLLIPLSPEKAIDTLLHGHIRRIDYGMANEHTFFCTCGLGFDAQVSENFSRESSRGLLMYIKSVVGCYMDYKPEEYEIIYPGGRIKEKALLVTCANASQYGNNAIIAPQASLEDGYFNLAILKPLGLLDIPQTTLQLFSHNIDQNKHLIQIKTKEAVIRRKQAGWIHVDGDPVYESEEIHLKLIPQGLQVLVP